MAEQQQDVDALKRRGRRRLVGAVALVLLAVIVLPMVFDPEPRRAVPPVSVRIPGENDSAFTPQPPKPVAPKAVPSEESAVASKPSVEPKAAPPKPLAPKPAPSERARAEAALAGAEYVVTVGAFANADGVVARLSAAKMPHYTEAAPRNLTRVVAGPFTTKEAADKAAERLKALGLKPGRVATRAG